MQAAGLGLAAVSYDTPAVLKHFSDQNGIHYPLLADPRSEIIRRFGILNTQLEPTNRNYGIPYPGVYVLDGRLLVQAKYFEDDYHERDTAGLILLRQFGLAADAPHASTQAKHLTVSSSATDRRVFARQRLALVLDVDLSQGVHVYAPGVTNYIPIDWRVDHSEALQVLPAAYPEPKVLRLEAIRESAPVYEGRFRLIRDVILSSDQELRKALDANNQLLVSGSLRYQACDRSRCFIPEEVPLHWTLHYAPLDRTRAPEAVQRR